MAAEPVAAARALHWDAVLIDLDGTLMDTAPDLAVACNRMRADLGLAALPTPRVAQFVGKGVEVLVHRALTDDPDGRAAPQDFAPAYAAFLRHYAAVNGEHSVVFDGVLPALAALRARGLRLGCVTNKARAFTVPLLARAGLAPWFEAVLAGDDVAHRKPHPALLLAACERLHVAPVRTVLVGDSANDAQAAHAAGCTALLVGTGYNEGEPVESLAGAPGVGAILTGVPEAAQWVLAGPSGGPA